MGSDSIPLKLFRMKSSLCTHALHRTDTKRSWYSCPRRVNAGITKTHPACTIHAKTECDYLNGWIKQRSHTQNISPKMVNPRDIAGERRRRCAVYASNSAVEVQSPVLYCFYILLCLLCRCGSPKHVHKNLNQCNTRKALILPKTPELEKKTKTTTTFTSKLTRVKIFYEKMTLEWLSGENVLTQKSYARGMPFAFWGREISSRRPTSLQT